MRAVRAVSQDYDEPLSGLRLEDVPEPIPPAGWTMVRVAAAALNPHDVWTLRGVGHPAERIPITLGCDAAGWDEAGNPVVIYPTLGDPDAGFGDITFDPARGLLSETVDGTLAEKVAVPRGHLAPKPEFLSFEEAAALPVTFGTAYRMLFTRGRLVPGQRVLVQGAAGGVSSAAILLARAAGAEVYATSRTEAGRAFAASLGAIALETGARLPELVDLVIETVGEATWAHSLRVLRRGGAVVIAGATSGAMPSADLARVFFNQLSVVGSTGCTFDEFTRMLRFVTTHGIRPPVAEVIGIDEAPRGFSRLIEGGVMGKIVVRIAS
ncbi:zinc-binding dehydrogenase [Microbacterium sp. ASV49]|uniref:Zinc-binding dehydrogenase n=1 Tax=Microbacterium candidum TaxID=3041922 RepID=A0ABT7MW50_9MICO|nr:zinc-binding dehydrogenase [Microbacterium sp. ASV49]MDL9978683.1 zinc-binding dehydrogenase [Microbacterium sp. ASV49]